MKKVESLIALLIKLGVINDTYYGTLTIKFQNGKIVNCIKEESIKL